MNMTEYKLELLSRAKRYLKSLNKQHELLSKIKDNLNLIQKNPFIGERNKGDLKNTYSVDFRYQKTTYEIAYYIKEETNLVLIILIGTRENFYDILKQYIRTSN